MSTNESDIVKITNHLQEIFLATEAALDDWKGEGCLQFSVLFKMVGIKMGADDDQVKLYDPIIRFFISQHSQYSSRRGARGGVIRIEDKLRMEKAKKEKETRKVAELKAREEVLKLVNDRVASNIVLTKEDMGNE